MASTCESAGRERSQGGHRRHETVLPPPCAAFSYEDDGISTDYLQGASSTTSLNYAPVPGQPACTQYAISTTGAGYAGLVETRNYTVIALQSCGVGEPPASVTVNGDALPEGPASGVPGTWFFSQNTTSASLLPCSVSAPQTVVLCCSTSSTPRVHHA